MSDFDKLSALLLQQAELSAQREERLAAMMERLMTRQLSTAAVTDPVPDDPGADGRSAAAARRTARLPTSATPAPYLTSSASLRELTVWAEKLRGYMMLTGACDLPVEGQRAALLSLLDEDWHRVIRFGLDLADGASLDTIVTAMEGHLRKQRNVLVDRRDFYARVQEPGECFDDFLCGVKEAASFCAFCEHCVDVQIRDRVVCGARDEEAVRRMLEDPELTLKRAVDICRASENARTTCQDLRGSEGHSEARLSAYKRGRSRSRGPRSRTAAAPTLAAAAAAAAADQRPRERRPRCGRRRHVGSDTCRAAGATCRACGELGHFATVCRQGASTTDGASDHAVAAPAAVVVPGPTGGPPARGPPPARSSQRAQYGRDIKQVIADIHISGVCTRPAPMVNVQLIHQTGSSTLECTPDTGAEATVMGDAVARSLGLALPVYRPTTEPNSPPSDAVRSTVLGCSARRCGWVTASSTSPSTSSADCMVCQKWK
ncbi:hypothetical protein FJT64_014078 [Amphibalanus amphitrite]|uniref:CCHC-type domain-containing protein n=1 Tax=Amphibalanus amphitrite TaxID=1232801 RepID=A0A6A4V306_AMPAM|nr:hypothetical protein FJT64_014078 [Amphibalanus amphitrite]